MVQEQAQKPTEKSPLPKPAVQRENADTSINEFKSGNSDRGASIRIPIATANKGYGYLEDRRPGANSDPYLVSARILVSVCELNETLMNVKSEELVKA